MCFFPILFYFIKQFYSNFGKMCFPILLSHYIIFLNFFHLSCFRYNSFLNHIYFFSLVFSPSKSYV